MKEVVHIEAQESYAVKILDKSHAENDVEDMVREFQMLRALRTRTSSGCTRRTSPRTSCTS